MFPPEFDYERADSVAEAVDRLAAHTQAGADAELLAGGHGLVPAMKAGDREPDAVVDLDTEDLVGVTEREDSLAVGALTTYSDLADSTLVREHAPVLADAVAEVGDVQIRNRGTLGGNLVEAHPAADPPAAVLAADATLVLVGPDGEREVPATEFFVGERETVVDPAEILTEIRVPAAGDGTNARTPETGTRDAGASGAGSTDAAYVRRTHPATGYALVGVAAVLDRDGETVTDARVAATGVVEHAVRLPAVEAALAGGPVDADARTAAAATADDDLDTGRFRSDPSASGEFRQGLLATYVERALAAAVV